MAIYKNHSRKLEQHTHCHSFFRPFSLLTHCLTMCVTYLRPWMTSPHCERGRKMRVHRPINWNPQTPPTSPPPRRYDRGIHFLCKQKQVNSLLPRANWMESLWSSLQDEVYFMGGGAAGGLWRNQQWTPSWPPCWILPRIRNQVKCAINGDFLCLTWKITHK